MNVWAMDDGFRVWIRDLEAIIDAEFEGVELGGIQFRGLSVMPWHWRQLYDEGLSPRQAWNKRKE